MSARLVEYLTVENVVCLLGMMIFGIWLLKTSFGRRALSDSVARRNNMPIYLPFVPLVIWFGSVGALSAIREKLLTGLSDWQIAFFDNLILCAVSIIAGAVIVFLVRVSFVRRLKGFGFDAKTIGRDFFAGVVNVLGVWPIVMVMMVLTIFVGGVIFGSDYEMQQHRELKLIVAYPQLSLRILIVVAAVGIVPVFEEMLFRGLFQTMIRSVLEKRKSECESGNKAWAAIVLSSSLFAMVHTNQEHWPALFALGMCLGYSYERSGSLFRPIFIHLFFNGVTVIAALNQ